MSPRLACMLLLLLGCNKLNPDYCDKDIACAVGQVCSALNACVAASSSEDLAMSMPPDQATRDQATPDLKPAPDLSPLPPDMNPGPPCGNGNGDCTCTMKDAAGCKCATQNNCTVSCGDRCPDPELLCDASNNCTVKCGSQCGVKCKDSNNCTVTVGVDSTIVCEKSTCTITCVGACTVDPKTGPATGTINSLTCLSAQFPKKDCGMGKQACGTKCP